MNHFNQNGNKKSSSLWKEKQTECRIQAVVRSQCLNRYMISDWSSEKDKMEGRNIIVALVCQLLLVLTWNCGCVVPCSHKVACRVVNAIQENPDKWEANIWSTLWLVVPQEIGYIEIWGFPLVKNQLRKWTVMCVIAVKNILTEVYFNNL